jgi:hypothetical protein
MTTKILTLPACGCPHRFTRRLLAVVGALLMTAPAASPQYPWGSQSTTLTGSTVGTNLRNAAQVVRTQAEGVRRGAGDWGRRASSAGYGATQFQQDFTSLQFQFMTLRDNFNSMASFALQTGRPRAGNAVAELDAGLQVIGELFPFLQGQFNAGALDRQTIVRTSRALEDAMREWEREFRKCGSRIGLVW